MRLPFRLDGWSIGAMLIAVIVLAPMLSVLWIAFNPTENIWPHLLSTVLPRYFGTTLYLMAGVGVLTAAVGTGAAWLVTMYRFPGVRWLDHALLFPLAIPAYVGAYALVDFLQYAGPVQTAMRGAMGWQSARDYWFPEVRSEEMAIVGRGAFPLTMGCLAEKKSPWWDWSKMLLPNRFPTAISPNPSRIAAIETAISGRDVETARNKVPTNVLPNPVCWAIPSTK